MGDWSFLTNHALAMLFIRSRPDVRLRDLAVALGVTERTAFAIVVDLTEGGFLVKGREGRRNRYQIQTESVLKDSISGDRTIGELLRLFADRTATPAPLDQAPI